LFVLATGVMGWNAPAYDLRASYVAGKLVALGQGGHLYDQVGQDAAREDHSAWAQAAMLGGIQDRTVTPYIQAPLWAWFIAPFAKSLSVSTFKRIFLGLTAACMVGIVFSATRQWAPRLASPWWRAGLLAALFVTVPYRTSIELGQTHILFLYLVTQAIIAEQRGRFVLAGIVLAVCAYTKITPMWIALTWLSYGNRRAAASFAVSSAVLVAATPLACGWANLASFLVNLAHNATSVLLTFNNDSLASVLLQGRLDQDTAFRFQPVHIPVWVSCLSNAALLTSAIVIGLYERTREGRRIGPIFTLVAATVFTPLAWNHYFVVLVLPMILFVDLARQRRAAWWLVPAVVVLVLNIPPLAYAGGSSLWVVALRSQFWAALLCLIMLALVPNVRIRATRNEPSLEGVTP
jgi:uncharacterized membrane protein YdcZ (DUF606 family)